MNKLHKLIREKNDLHVYITRGFWIHFFLVSVMIDLTIKLQQCYSDNNIAVHANFNP